ncbi:MAG: DUF58 domain-containing protein [Pirellulales bacterium]|nr:DUF58 domain-containing protein [Pirellulales bacterium]
MTAFAWVLLKLTAAALPLFGLAWGAKIYPRLRLIYLGLIPGLIALGLWAWAGLVWVVLAVDAAVVAVAVFDLLSLPRRKAFAVEREAGRIASLRKPHPVTLTVQNFTLRPYALTVRDGVPPELTPEPEEFSTVLPGRSRSVMWYQLRPRRRGAFVIDPVYLRAVSRWRFWQRLLRYPHKTAVAVYPDLKQLGEYALLARTNRLSLLGVRRTRRVGQDHDFERLRDYTRDDNYKHIDWRATARRQKLTVRDFQLSQSQRVVFLVDCGRMMTNQAAGLSLLDHALNAVLMLGYVALRQGDAVGLITFSDVIHSFVPPRGGRQQMNRLLHACFDRFPQLTESRYDQAFRYLAAHCRKRSLVVLVTNVIDELNANQIQQYLRNLAGRHLPLGILLRERRLFDAVEVEHPQEEQLWPAAAAAEILAWRNQVLGDLVHQGVLVLDVFPEQMTAPLVNRYLEIKARHLL